MRSYRYQSLQHDDSFRLLVLHPSLNGTDSDPIRCTIQHARLCDESLKYEAVSYTWGNAAQTQAIYFQHDTKELHVGQNCYNALWRLRRMRGDRLLWIDAICIDQDNLQERASQVRIMDRIYNCAFTVLVVLSEPSTHSSALFEELAAADEEISLTGDCKRGHPSGTIVALLEELYQDPWFKRVWVLQEVHAKSSVKFICGSASFSHRSLDSLSMGHSKTLVTKTFKPVALRWISYPPGIFSTSQFTLWNRLYSTRDCLATEPKDRVFALKSLLGPRQTEMNHLIDYTRSVEECYTHVAAFLLPVLGLRLLTAIRHPHDKKMPSWIPDWSQNTSLNYYSFEYESRYFDLLGGQSSPFFCAADKQTHTTRSFLDESHEHCLELFVSGCRHAQIVETSQAFHFVDADDASMQLKRLYSSFISLGRYVDSEDTIDNPIVLAHLGKDIRDAMSCMDGEQLHEHLSRYDGGSEENALDADYNIVMLMKSLQQCKICLTDDGELIVVSEAVQCGDVIAMFSGALSVCLLRPFQDGSWALISGDCHLFTEEFHDQDFPEAFNCDKYVACNPDRLEEFRVR